MFVPFYFHNYFQIAKIKRVQKKTFYSTWCHGLIHIVLYFLRWLSPLIVPSVVHVEPFVHAGPRQTDAMSNRNPRRWFGGAAASIWFTVQRPHSQTSRQADAWQPDLAPFLLPVYLSCRVAAALWTGLRRQRPKSTMAVPVQHGISLTRSCMDERLNMNYDRNN